MIEKKFEELTESEKVVFVYQGFAHIEDVLDWSNTPEGLKETLETQPYFFKRLNQLLESLGIDTSEVSNANLSNYDAYRNKYEILKKMFTSKYPNSCNYYNLLPDNYGRFGDYLGTCSLVYENLIDSILQHSP